MFSPSPQPLLRFRSLPPTLEAAAKSPFDLPAAIRALAGPCFQPSPVGPVIGQPAFPAAPRIPDLASPPVLNHLEGSRSIKIVSLAAAVVCQNLQLLKTRGREGRQQGPCRGPKRHLKHQAPRDDVRLKLSASTSNPQAINQCSGT